MQSVNSSLKTKTSLEVYSMTEPIIIEQNNYAMQRLNQKGKKRNVHKFKKIIRHHEYKNAQV